MFSLAFACIACIVAAIVTFAAPAYAESTTYDGENTFIPCDGTIDVASSALTQSHPEQTIPSTYPASQFNRTSQLNMSMETM